MTDQDSEAEDNHNEFRDRRGNTDLRLIFDKACEMTASFFDSRNGWDGSSLNTQARQALCEAYPELTQEEVTTLYLSVERHHSDAPEKD